MASTTSKSWFWTGFQHGVPFVLVAAPFGTLFGVLATETGLNLTETMIFAITVFAGAAQFTALQLMQEHAPVLIVLASALAVNMRMAMYSASLTPYLGAAPLWQRAIAAYFTVDQSYACSVAMYEARPEMTTAERMAYFFGVVAPLAPMWYFFTFMGAVLGTRIPDSLAIDFALPIAFLAMIAPMLRTPAHIVAAVVACITSILAAGLPFNLGLIVAGIIAMMAGAQTELALEHRKTRP
jgi:predicted branched-subunit amino acid permease